MVVIYGGNHEMFHFKYHDLNLKYRFIWIAVRGSETWISVIKLSFYAIHRFMGLVDYLLL